MPAWRLRDFRDEDLDQAIRVWDQNRTDDEPAAVFPVSEVMAAARARQPAVVAVVGDELVGMVVAHAQGERAWVLLVALAAQWRHQGLGSSLLAEVERRLRAAGIHRISALLPETATGAAALCNSGFQQRTGLTYYEKPEQTGADAGLLAAVGGRVLPAGLWDAVAGMDQEKRIIERRIVLPLAEPAMADRYGVVPPKGVILFGPPGTGKTSFAKAVASRLAWPFVELFPSRLAADARGNLATALRGAFADLTELAAVLVFIDEVEEIASARSESTTLSRQGVTNELLKLIPGFRERDNRLLICATNSVRSLDPAFLRPGRFDYIIPIGPPDQDARSAIWQRYLRSVADIDLRRLVDASDMFTPADIELAVRAGAQAAFEHELTHHENKPASTDDYLAAITGTRPTLTERAVQEFTEDITTFSRI